jgi:phthiodiolone/phenolphthiodiolone dimycocerosates ketoreductase
MSPLKFGLTGISFPPIEAGISAAKAYEDAGLEFLAYWDQLSLTIPRSIWTPDLVPAAKYWDIDTWLDSWQAMAAAALATEKIEFMTVSDCRRPPPIIAQQALTLNNISKGRFMLCMGAGETKQFAPYDLPRDKPFGRLEEGMKILRMFFDSNEPIDYDGPIWSLKNAIVGLPAYEDKPPPLMIAGGPGRAMRIAGQLSDGWMSYLPPCGTPEMYAEQVQDLRKRTEEAGRNPDDLTIMLGTACVVADTEQKVDDACSSPALRWDAAALCPDGESFRRMCGRDNPLGPEWSYPRDLIPMNVGRDEALDIVEQLTADDVRAARFCGTPQQVAAQLQPYIEAGATHVLALNYADLVLTGDFGDATGGAGEMLELIDIMRRRNS